MKKYYFKSVVAIVLVTVIIVNSFLGNGSVAHAKVSDRPGINTDTKQEYKENEKKGSTWNPRNSSASASKKSDKTKVKKWDNRKTYEKALKSGVKAEKKAKKSKHRGSVSGGIKKFLLDITGISFGKKFLNVCSRLAGKGFCGIGKFMYNTKGQFLGALQFAGGVIQLAAAIGLCSTGAGAILGIPMMLHAVADMAQGGSLYINAVLGKKVLSEANFMEEAYKAVGGFIGNIVGGAEGRKIGKKIASGTFVVADLAMAFATPEGAAKLASKFKSVDSMADAMKIFGRMFGQSISGLGKKAKKAYSGLSGLVNSTWKNSQKLAREVKKVGKTFAETWNNYPKDKRVALSSNGVGEIEKFVDKFTGTIRETSKKVRESAENVVDSAGRDGKAGNSVKGSGNSGKLPSAKGLFDKDFEDYLSKNIGGHGSFKVGGREFDGGIGNRWWEAKSGPFWDNRVNDPKAISKFKSDMGDRLRITKENGATYELFSNTPIPPVFKVYLIKKGIPFTEILE